MLTKPFKPLALAFLVNLIISVEDKIKYKVLKLFIDWLTNGSVFSETSALRLRLVRKSERRAFGYR